MKKIALVIAAVVCSMSMNAQTVKLYKGETLVGSYSASEVDKLVFENEAAPTPSDDVTGTAKANINGTEKDVKWVQLWENGPKFAEFNVGATSVTECGDYFAWGETEPYYNKPAQFEGNAITSWKEGKELGYKWDSYTKHTNGIYNWNNMAVFTKYVPEEKSNLGYEGFTDGLLVLQPEDDAATANWGSNWCTFTKDDVEALARNCYVEWTADYQGVPGIIVYKVKNDKDKAIQKIASGALKILPEDKRAYQNGTEENPVVLTETYSTADTHVFFPCCGYASGTTVSGHPTTAYPSAKYMTVSLLPTSPTSFEIMGATAYGLSIPTGSGESRYYGFTVRPIVKE